MDTINFFPTRQGFIHTIVKERNVLTISFSCSSAFGGWKNPKFHEIVIHFELLVPLLLISILLHLLFCLGSQSLSFFLKLTPTFLTDFHFCFAPL